MYKKKLNEIKSKIPVYESMINKIRKNENKQPNQI